MESQSWNFNRDFLIFNSGNVLLADQKKNKSKPKHLAYAKWEQSSGKTAEVLNISFEVPHFGC